MKKQDENSIQENIYAILYKRILTYDEYYIFIPCQCVEGYYDKSDKSFMDIYNNLYYSCDNYTMINTGQSDTYYYDTSLDDIKNMTSTDDPEEAISKFYDRLKSNILIGRINEEQQMIDIYEINKDKLELLKNNAKFNTTNGKGSVTLTRRQVEKFLEEDEGTVKDQIKVLVDKLTYLENFSKVKNNIDLSVVISYNALMTQKSIEKARNNNQKLLTEDLEKLEKKEQEQERTIMIENAQDAYEYITSRMVGQDEGVKAVLGAILNNMKAKTHDEIIRPFIIGGTGSGKSYLFKLIEKILDVPVIIVDCNQLVQSGYEGKTMEDVLKDLYLLCERDKESAERAIVVFDEIDKTREKGATVSDYGAQCAALKAIEGQKYVINLDKYEMEKVIIDTSMMSIVACGAFEEARENNDKPVGFSKTAKVKEENIIKLIEQAGMIPELLGRFNLYIKYNDVTKEMIKEQLQHSLSSPTKIKEEFYLNNYGIELVFTNNFLERLCNDAMKNKTGFRGVDQVVNQALSEVNFKLQIDGNQHKQVIIDEETIDNPKKYTLK